ncbi:MAG: hypothetical protein ACYTFG_10640 [Planctomycetota bacterium]|jgi:hypothetical protein
MKATSLALVVAVLVALGALTGCVSKTPSPGESGAMAMEGGGDDADACRCEKGKSGKDLWCESCDKGWFEGRSITCESCFRKMVDD